MFSPDRRKGGVIFSEGYGDENTRVAANAIWTTTGLPARAVNKLESNSNSQLASIPLSHISLHYPLN
ncbi:MAG: hypothetical protein ABIE14_04940 [Patescibacteria group bacterium]